MIYRNEECAACALKNTCPEAKAMPEEKKPAEDWGSPGKAPDPLAWENVQKKAYLKTPTEPAQGEAVTKERLKKMAKNPAKWLYGKLKFIAESEDE